MSLIIDGREDNRPKCDCKIYQRCAICDPEGFASNKEEVSIASAHRDEQEGAAILDGIQSVLFERLKGMNFSITNDVDEATDTLVITIKRARRARPCKIRIDLSI